MSMMQTKTCKVGKVKVIREEEEKILDVIYFDSTKNIPN